MGLWEKTKQVAQTYTWTFIVVLMLNQLLFFGFCLNPVCLIAAMPHCLAITVFVGTYLNRKAGFSKGNSENARLNEESIGSSSYSRNSSRLNVRSTANNTAKNHSLRRDSESNSSTTVFPAVENSAPQSSATLANKEAHQELEKQAPSPSAQRAYSQKNQLERNQFVQYARNSQARKFKGLARDRQTKSVAVNNTLPASNFSEQSISEMSTSAIGRMFGIEARPDLFNLLIDENLLEKSTSGYILTPKGIRAGGSYKSKDSRSKWVVWTGTYIPQLIVEYKKSLLKRLPIQCLYHMTHSSNLKGIFEHGLLNHNNSFMRTDISNIAVNQRRSRVEPIYNRPVHDYVPLYLNVKNAMLYTVQKTFSDDIVILELSKDIFFLPNIVFSFGNAAGRDAQFFRDFKRLGQLDLKSVYSPSWSVDGVTNTHLKTAMMSEVLVAEKINSHYISTVHCSSSKKAQMLRNFFSGVGFSVQIAHTPRLFFDTYY